MDLQLKEDKNTEYRKNIGAQTGHLFFQKKNEHMNVVHVLIVIGVTAGGNFCSCSDGFRWIEHPGALFARLQDNTGAICKRVQLSRICCCGNV